jgi:hypothetical protein
MNDKARHQPMALARGANLEMLRGNAEPIKRLYSHSDDVADSAVTLDLSEFCAHLFR